MQGCVIDCSVTIAWLMPDEKTDKAETLLEKVVQEGAIVPAIWRIEVLNVLLNAERCKRIIASHRKESLTYLTALPIAVDGEMNIRAWHEIADLAEKQRLTAYDATYLELAIRLKLPIATFDKELQQAARRANLKLL